MEKRKKKRNPLTALLLVLGAILLLGLAMAGTVLLQRACRAANRPQTTARPTATATPEPTPIPDRSYDYANRPSFTPAIDRLGIGADEIAYYGEERFAAENWLDLTPDALKGEWAVIRNIALGYSYLVHGDEYYRLGEGDDGKGVLDVLVSDLDEDGAPELLYTYHFGVSTDAQTKIGWFNLETRTGTLSSFGMQNGFLALSEEDGAYIVYRCTRTVDRDGGFALHFTDRIGELVEQAGALYLMME